MEMFFIQLRNSDMAIYERQSAHHGGIKFNIANINELIHIKPFFDYSQDR